VSQKRQMTVLREAFMSRADCVHRLAMHLSRPGVLFMQKHRGRVDLAAGGAEVHAAGVHGVDGHRAAFAAWAAPAPSSGAAAAAKLAPPKSRSAPRLDTPPPARPASHWLSRTLS
jgi:hypothetical protein